jgi:hypothetical protein
VATPCGQRPSSDGSREGPGRKPLSEDHGTYDDIDPEPTGGVKPIGEILRQVIDECGWPLSAVSPRPNGDSPDNAGSRDD